MIAFVPLQPRLTWCQKRSRPAPNVETTPMPVMTTPGPQADMRLTIIRRVHDPRPASAIERALAWTGAALFALSLGYFLYTYVVTFGEISAAATASPWRAVSWNAALFGSFAAHHSVFARLPVRAWMASHVRTRLERSVYVWIASLLLIAVCALWQPLPGVAWDMTGAWRWIIRIPLVAGIWLTLRSAGIIDIWELAGIRRLATPDVQLPTPKHSQHPTTNAQTPNHQLPTAGEFKASGPYGLVRHPIYLGWIIVVFSVPTMTMTRLAFAVISCAYLVLAIPFEERTIRATAGAAYGRYAQRVRWRLVPGVW